MMNKSLIYIIAFVVIIGAGSFYAGLEYGQQRGFASITQGNFSRQSGMMGGGKRGNGMGMGGNGSGGEIISKDDVSITIKLRDGGSKIIFLSNVTQVMKSVQGLLSDLAIGDQIVTQGSANADGSMTAKSIQIRPNVIPSTKQ